MSRILSIDYGKRRVGFAISDPENKLVFPIGTIDLKKTNIYDYLSNLYLEKPFSKVLIGKSPRKEVFYESLYLACLLRRRFKVEVIFWDEEYTSRYAEEILKSMGKRIKKENKYLLDSISAYIMLCEYLGFSPLCSISAL